MHSEGRRIEQLPSSPGTYALVLFCPRARQVKIGQLGTYALEPGWYVYVGSALGPGGLRARYRRHCCKPERQRWHIDYLKKAASVKAIWFSSDPVRREHQWAKIVGQLPEAGTPIPKFGSSDCSCPSHLFFFHTRPSVEGFRRAAQRLLRAHAPISELVSDLYDSSVSLVPQRKRRCATASSSIPLTATD
jgi:Uri superfamily endonuclease